MIEIDGAHGEGGGQILRTSIALSTLTGTAVRIFNIRANRPKPGLSYQHLTAIEVVAELSNGTATGLHKGSKVVEFQPGKLKGGRFSFDIGTAGSVTLVLQACLLPLLYARESTELLIRGGTDVKWSPPIDYFEHVFSALLRRMGADVKLELKARGYYPKGGGEVEVRIEPVNELRALDLSRATAPKKINGVVHISKLPEHVLKRMKHSALKRLVNYDVSIKDDMRDSPSAGAGIVLWTDTLSGASSLGERGVPAEKVGAQAADVLLADIRAGATVDVFAADQVLTYLALAKGRSTFLTRTLSNHAKTGIWLIEQFLDTKFSADAVGALRRVVVEGVA